MITLITGTPGSGKTAWMLNELIEVRKNNPEKLLFIHGVRNLNGIPHEQIFCTSQLCDICRSQDEETKAKLAKNEAVKFVENWQDWKQPDSIIIIDEVQRIWRPRAASGKPPEDISLLETHRHYGLDFWLISQGPHLFDSFIRLLIGRHIHLVAKWNGRTQYEWPECKQNLASKADAVTRPYKLPKRVYSLYSSAEVHTKQPKRVPMALYVAPIALIITGILVYRTFSSMHEKSSVTVSTAHATVLTGAGQSIPGQVEAKIEKTEQDIQHDLTPKIPTLPWTAPIYHEIAKPVTFPKIQGCITSGTADKRKCACYSQQATRIDMPASICEIYAKNGAFDMFKPDPVVTQVSENNQSTYAYQPLNNNREITNNYSR
jgi:zona occludens toxin